ncbi:MAG: type II CAAX endopeptidase family protein [Lysobacteraceae bacterium]
MSTSPSLNEADVSQPRFWPWLVRAPLTRIVVFMILLIGMLFATAHIQVALQLPASSKDASAWQLVPIVLFKLLSFAFAYWLLVRLIEQRKVVELAARKLLPHSLAGFGIGVALMLAVTGMLWLAGAYSVVGTDAQTPWLRNLILVGVLPGITEEIVSRGVLYRIVEEGMGSWIALIVSSLIFGFMHAMNAHATLWSCLAIAIEAGLLLGLLFTVTRSLYVCMGLHAGWNFVQGAVLGIPVSGTDPHGLLVATLQGPTWLSGGLFGAEASVVSVALLGGMSCALAMLAIRRGLIVPPFWRRNLRIARNNVATLQ